MNNLDISVVIPVFNSCHSIEEVVLRLIHTLEGEQKTFEIILVDDLSGDDSLIVLNELKEMDRRITVLPLDQNYGQQKALVYGMQLAKGEYIITMDDDLEHQPEDIVLLIREIIKGFDVVYGIHQNKNYAYYRKWGSKLVDIFFTRCFHKPKHIKVSSFRIIRRSIVDKILQDKTPFVYITAIILRTTENIGNIYVRIGLRRYGKSNYNFFKLIKLFIRLFLFYGKQMHTPKE
ncbi:MAG: glycosyltransferase family 2 protein [Eubacteriales bacterium]